MPFGSSQWMYSSGFYPTEIDQSLMFDGTSYLSRTPSVAGNLTTWTWSSWVKRGALSGSGTYTLFSGGGGPSITTNWIGFANDKLTFVFADGTYSLQSTAVYRDPSAFYHIVAVYDSGNATSSNRMKLYVNGVQITSFSTSTYVTQNYASYINGANGNYLGLRASYGDLHYNGYLADTYFVDGTALDPTSFGEFKSGVWIPKAYTGSYGTNGFHLTYQDDTVSEGFNTVTYTGNGVQDRTVSGIGFEPDFTWIKDRSAANTHVLFDSVRGGTKQLFSNLTNSEQTNTDLTNGFASDGFIVGDNITGTGATNLNSNTYVAWCWDAGDSTVSNTDGSITSSVRANPAYGFSIVSWAGNSTNGATVGHGLSSAPSILITKSRTNASSWIFGIGGMSGFGVNDYLTMQTNNAKGSSSTFYQAYGANTFTTGVSGGAELNKTGNNYVTYCFSEIAGYSKFGSYTGTGASGNVVTTGFKPAFVMIKNTSSTGEWMMFDATRSAAGKITNELYANTSDADATVLRGTFDSNGFTIDSTSASLNTSSATYIYMAFADTRDLAFWRDQSGNGNDWQPTNLNYQDTVFDSPTNNYCTLNPLDKDGHTNSEGNLKVSGNVIYGHEKSTFAVTSGKWYFEAALTVQQNDTAIGLANQSASTSDHYLGQTTDSVGYLSDGRFFYNNSSTSYSSWTTSDVAQIAFDADTGEIWIGKNNTYQNSGDPANGTGEVVTVSWNEFIPAARTVGSGALVFNFGQSGFTYTPPTGFLALSTANLPEPSINPANGDSPQDHFNTVLWTGNSANPRSITGVGFQPDWVWAKQRTGNGGGWEDHQLYDSVRGTQKVLRSNTTNAELENPSNGGVQSFDSDGFAIQGPSGSLNMNNTGENSVAWNWKASNATAVSNTAGTITSQVSANTTAGFSIVSYTGNGTNGATIGHGLGATPAMIITKKRNSALAWYVWHQQLSGANYGVALNTLDAEATFSYGTWGTKNSTIITATQGINGLTNVNASSDTYVAYCFNSVEGYSKFGSYTGNGSTDGTFVYTGFRPAYVMVKRYTDVGNWQMFDSSRDLYNPEDGRLYANLSDSENDAASIDFVSNGFKLRATSGDNNSSGQSYIYMAFAENPFKYANAR
jgi:hypothetical protein